MHAPAGAPGLRPGIRIPPTLSVVLDTFRIALAVLVAVGHWTQRYFQDGVTDLTPVAMLSVGGFFALSGFTIRALTVGTDLGPRAYFRDRLSRLWSVMLPALVLTVACDLLAYTLNREFYLRHWGGGAGSALVGLVANALFVSQVWGLNISPMSNSPFWSLSYEMGFYLVYGAWLARGWVAAALACLLLGPNITVMLAVWGIGVAIYELYDRLTFRRAAWTAGICAALLAAMAWHWLWLYDAASSASLDLIRAAFGLIGLSRGRIHPLLFIGAAVCAVLMLLLVSLARMNDERRLVDVLPVLPLARRLGEFTFPLYLCHFPIFVLFAAWGGYDRGSPLQAWGVWFAALAAIYVVVLPVTVWCKTWLRARLTRVIG